MEPEYTDILDLIHMDQKRKMENTKYMKIGAAVDILWIIYEIVKAKAVNK